jgi:hypothetical protein
MPRRKSINPFAFACGVFGIVILTKIASYLTPYKLYFSFSSFLYSHRSIFRWEALTLKLLIPCVVGFLLFYLPFQLMIFTKGSTISYRTLYRYLSLQSEITAKAVGFSSALLLAWPFIIYWDILMQIDLQPLRFPFLCIYFLYFISYSYFAGLGVHLARLALQEQLPQRATRDVTGHLMWLETLRTSVLGIVTSAIATYFASRLGGSQ